jgi:hypothetical protein
MSPGTIQRAAIVLGLATACALAQAVPAFNASGLIKPGDEVKYGSYTIIKLGDGIHQIADRKDLMIFTGDSIGIGAGRSLRSAARLKEFAEDTQELVAYLTKNLSPYERHALKVYTGTASRTESRASTARTTRCST